jgi:hypothetical protein
MKRKASCEWSMDAAVGCATACLTVKQEFNRSHLSESFKHHPKLFQPELFQG